MCIFNERKLYNYTLHFINSIVFERFWHRTTFLLMNSAHYFDLIPLSHPLTYGNLLLSYEWCGVFFFLSTYLFIYFSSSWLCLPSLSPLICSLPLSIFFLTAHVRLSSTLRICVIFLSLFFSLFPSFSFSFSQSSLPSLAAHPHSQAINL